MVNSDKWYFIIHNLYSVETLQVNNKLVAFVKVGFESLILI